MGELRIDKIKVGQVNEKHTTYKPKEKETSLASNLTLFDTIQKNAQKTDYVDDIKIYFNNADTDKQTSANDVIAKSLNLKDSSFLQNSDMLKVFLAINSDDFNIKGDLFNFSDIAVKTFSQEKDGYGIVDEGGNVYKFDKNGCFLAGNGNKFTSINDALSQAVISCINTFGKVEEDNE